MVQHARPAQPPVPVAAGWMNAPTGGAVGSTTLVRELNERSMLDLLRSNGPMSRVEIARRTGLSKPTVSAALANLVRSQLVTEDGAESGKRGPAAVIYRAESRAGFVMSIDVGRTWIRALVADLAGVVFARCDTPNRCRSAAALIEAIDELITKTRVAASKELQTNRKAGPIIAVTVVGGPGVLHEATGTMRVAGGLPGWGNVGFVHELRAHIGGEVLFENDINLAALGEHVSGAAIGMRDFVLLSIGNGIGCGIVLSNQLFRGATGSAGEAGFLPIGASDSLQSKRLKDETDDRTIGVLERSVGADGIVQQAKKMGLTVHGSSEVFALATDGNKKAKQVVDVVAELVGQTVTVLTSLFDPQLIVVTGGVGMNLDALQPKISATVRSLSPFDPTIVAGSLGDAAVLFGGIAVGLPVARNRLFTERTSRP